MSSTTPRKSLRLGPQSDRSLRSLILTPSATPKKSIKSEKASSTPRKTASTPGIAVSTPSKLRSTPSRAESTPTTTMSLRKNPVRSVKKRLILDEDEEKEDEQMDISYQPTLTSDYFQDVSVKVKKSENTLKNFDLSVIRGVNKKCLEQEKIMELVIDHCRRELFPQLYSLLTNNFNVILYGLGSKRNVLDAFKERYLSDERFLKICGYFMELNLRIILLKLGKLLGLEATNEEEFYERAVELKEDIFLIIHSIDVLFRTDPKIKKFLINLYVKSNGKLHIIATVDHLNAALMFDLKDEQKLNIVCLEATTYESYHLEIGYIESSSSKNKKKGIMNFDEQTLTINSMVNVYNSIPTNSQKVLLLIFTEWLSHNEFRKMTERTENLENDDTKGLVFDTILAKCKLEFIAHTRAQLNQYLKEYVDHNLIKKVLSDGCQHLIVLIQDHLIKRFMNEIENITSNT